MKKDAQIKIIACDTDAISNSKLEQIMQRQQFKSILLKTEAKYLEMDGGCSSTQRDIYWY